MCLSKAEQRDNEMLSRVFGLGQPLVNRDPGDETPEGLERPSTAPHASLEARVAQLEEHVQELALTVLRLALLAARPPAR